MVGDGKLFLLPNLVRDPNRINGCKHIIRQGEDEPGLNSMQVGVFTYTEDCTVPGCDQGSNEPGQAESPSREDKFVLIFLIF